MYDILYLSISIHPGVVFKPTSQMATRGEAEKPKTPRYKLQSILKNSLHGILLWMPLIRSWYWWSYWCQFYVLPENTTIARVCGWWRWEWGGKHILNVRFVTQRFLSHKTFVTQFFGSPLMTSNSHVLAFQVLQELPAPRLRRTLWQGFPSTLPASTACKLPFIFIWSNTIASTACKQTTLPSQYL